MKKVSTCIFITMIVMLFVPTAFSAMTEHNMGGWMPVSWTSTTRYDNNYCYGSKNSSERAFVNYGFLAHSGWDEIIASAKNNCKTDSSYQIRVKSKNGSGVTKTGNYVSKGSTSQANQGAVRGTDYVTWYAKT